MAAAAVAAAVAARQRPRVAQSGLHAAEHSRSGGASERREGPPRLQPSPRRPADAQNAALRAPCRAAAAACPTDHTQVPHHTPGARQSVHIRTVAHAQGARGRALGRGLKGGAAAQSGARGTPGPAPVTSLSSKELSHPPPDARAPRSARVPRARRRRRRPASCHEASFAHVVRARACARARLTTSRGEAHTRMPPLFPQHLLVAAPSPPLQGAPTPARTRASLCDVSGRFASFGLAHFGCWRLGAALGRLAGRPAPGSAPLVRGECAPP